MAKKREKMSDRIRTVIKSAEQSQYRIAKETGIEQSTLSRFMSGERGLSMDALDTLFEYFDLEVVSRRKQRS